MSRNACAVVTFHSIEHLASTFLRRIGTTLDPLPDDPEGQIGALGGSIVSQASHGATDPQRAMAATLALAADPSNPLPEEMPLGVHSGHKAWLVINSFIMPTANELRGKGGALRPHLAHIPPLYKNTPMHVRRETLGEEITPQDMIPYCAAAAALGIDAYHTIAHLR